MREDLKYRISGLIEKCKSMRMLKQIHSQIITSIHLPKTHNYFLIARLLFVCAISEWGSLSYATDVFRLIQNPILSVYNIMIRAYACKDNGVNEVGLWQPIILYKQMLCTGIAPNYLTFPFLVKDCTKRDGGGLGLSVHGQIIKFGFHGDLFVQNSLISLYSACGFLNTARSLFDGMPSRDVVSWNSLITGCLRSGEIASALELFGKMEERNVITWNSIITGLVQGGRPKEAIEYFFEMQVMSDGSVRPDKITIASVLSACASLGAGDHGKWVHSYLRRSCLECDLVIGTALVDMYGKCGCVESAVDVFRKMPKKDVLAWTAMISAFALHGLGKEAFDLLEEMETLGVKPNHVTFVGLLSACAHSGLVEKGRLCFDLMTRVYLIEPQVHHYACMVDLLSRAGLFEEVDGLIRHMPMQPDVFVWGALLGGCQIHRNVELGEKVAQYLIDLDPSNHAFYMILCDLYAKSSKFDELKRVRALMKQRGIRKTAAGCSMIEICGVVYEFSVTGSPEVVMEEVEWVLNGLSNQMKMEEGIHGQGTGNYLQEPEVHMNIKDTHILRFSVNPSITTSCLISMSMKSSGNSCNIRNREVRSKDQRPPVAGPVFNQLIHFSELFDYQASLAQKYITYRMILPSHSEIYTADPVNVEYILKTNFTNYGKGEYHCEIMKDLFGDGIFAVDGDKWRHQRKLASYEFSTKVLRDFSASVFQDNAAKLVLKVSVVAAAKQMMDLQDMLMKSTLDSIFKVGFGVDLDTLSGLDFAGNQFIRAFDDSNVIVYWRYVDPLWKIKKFLNLGSEAALKHNIKVIDSFVFELIRCKREQMKNIELDIGKEDILSRFLLENKKDPEKMNDQYLRDIILNFLIAGKDTSADTLTWFFYMLCKHPLVQEKVMLEVREASKADINLSADEFAKKLTEKALDKMQYLHAALTETLRLYPAVPMDGKHSEEDDILPDGFKVKKGDGMCYMPYAMGRMRCIWGEDAEEFRPERWLENGVFQPESPFKFTAFQAGPRICLGKEFAYRQMKTLTAALVNFFKFKLVDERKEARYRTMFTLHMDQGLHLYAFPRL